MITGLAGFVAGAAAMAVYNHFFSKKVAAIGDAIIAEFDKVKSKV